MGSQQSTGFIQAIQLGKQVSTSEGPLLILDDINFSIAAGTSVAIIGASGSGKTTLLGLLAGLDELSSGYVLMNDVNLGELDEDGRALLRAGMVGFVFQNFQLLQGLTALENVMLPLELSAVGQVRDTAKDILARVGLADRLHHYPSHLSGGEKTLCHSSCLRCQSTLLFADEPTGNLDQATGQRIIDLLFEINREQGTTLIMATHDEALASLCETRLYLQAGKLVQQ